MTVACPRTGRHPLARTLLPLTRRVAPDADLVARFVHDRDESAFAELVRRHGPAVLAVCRHTARHSHDADDAFQATFLVLAKKAHALDPARPVGAWLRGVAVRAACRAARRRRTVSLPELPHRDRGPDAEAVAEVRAAVAALPAHQRAAVERCELAGVSRADAARELGVAPGTLSSRLALARRALADRLRRRGFGPAVVAVPPALLAAANATASEVSSPTVVELAEAIMQSSWTGWKLAALGLATATLGVGLAAEPAPAPRPAVVERDRGRLVIGSEHGPIRVLTPDGVEVSRLTAAEVTAAGVELQEQVSFAINVKKEDARFLVTVPEAVTTRRPVLHPAGRVRPNGDIPIRTRRGLDLWTPGGPPAVRPLVADAEAVVAWSPDGRRAVVVGGGKHRLLGTATAATTPVAVPAGHTAWDWAADENWLLTTANAGTMLGDLLGVRRTYGLWRVPVGGGPAAPLTPDCVEGLNPRLSPDGRRVAYFNWPGRQALSVWTVEVATGERVSVAHLPHDAAAGYAPAGLAWSPDGTRLAWAACRVREPREPNGYELFTGTAAGADHRTVLTAGADEPFALYDWR